MTGFKSNSVIAVHLAALIGSLALAICSGQNPRIILYGLTIALLFRLWTVWLLSISARQARSQPWLFENVTRSPVPGEKSRPYRNEKTRKMSGIIGYTMGIFTLMFMIGVLQAMGGSSDFLRKEILLPELLWGTTIALVYWVDDLASRQIVIVPDRPIPINLGYNVSGMNFLLAAIFITSFIFVIYMAVFGMLFNSWHGQTPIAWLLLVVLGIIRFVHDIRLPKQNNRRLPG